MRGIRLALPTRMLTRGARVFINGETVTSHGAAGKSLRQLADTRCLPPATRTYRGHARVALPLVSRGLY